MITIDPGHPGYAPRTVYVSEGLFDAIAKVRRAVPLSADVDATYESEGTGPKGLDIWHIIADDYRYVVDQHGTLRGAERYEANPDHPDDDDMGEWVPIDVDPETWREQ